MFLESIMICLSGMVSFGLAHSYIWSWLAVSWPRMAIVGSLKRLSFASQISYSSAGWTSVVLLLWQRYKRASKTHKTLLRPRLEASFILLASSSLMGKRGRVQRHYVAKDLERRKARELRPVYAWNSPYLKVCFNGCVWYIKCNNWIDKNNILILKQFTWILWWIQTDYFANFYS